MARWKQIRYQGGFDFSCCSVPQQHIYNNIDTKVTDTNGLDQELMHIADTKTAFGETSFKEMWDKIAEVIKRLGATCKLLSLETDINNLLNDPLDFEREQELQNEIERLKRTIEEWMYIDNKIDSVLQKIDGIDKKLNEHGHEEICADKYFVKTTQYHEARKVLLNQKVIVLDGAPGEGKTTMAKELINEVSENKCTVFRTVRELEHIKFKNLDVNGIFIDDMFGAAVFDKYESRKWQKIWPRVEKWVDGSQNCERYVVVTSRTHILKEAMQIVHNANTFKKENIFTLSSLKLQVVEKREILTQHFEKARDNSNKEQKGKNTDSQPKTIDEKQRKFLYDTDFKSLGLSSTIGFPECARLFANNADIFSKGIEFFKTPMKFIKICMSDISKNDDNFVAFFVLWAQENKTLNCKDLELPVPETSERIKDPILKLQIRPYDQIRNIRKVLQHHVHENGFITLDFDGNFYFSHNVVRDAFGLIAYDKNATAVLAYCDVAFIDNYIKISNKRKPASELGIESENINITLPAFRYDQLSLRIATLVIPEKGTASESYLENYLIFKNPMFESEHFCAVFIKTNNDARNLKTLLTIELRTITSELNKYKFLNRKTRDTAIRLPSFLLWQTKKLHPLVKLFFSEMENYQIEELEKELFIGMFIGSMIGSHEIVEFLVERGGKVKYKMILLAYEALSDSRLNAEETKNTINFLQHRIGLAEPDGNYRIHIAVLAGCLDIVKEMLTKDPLHAQKTLTSANGDDLDRASLYHIAACKQNDVIINFLENKLDSKVYDAKGRSPFLYAIYMGKHKVVETLLKIANKNGDEMTPDNDKNTPLHIAIRKSVEQKDEAIRNVFRDLSIKICKTCTKNTHMENSQGKTPLHVACELDATEVVEELFKTNFHIAEEERLLMHKFVMSDNKKAIEILLKHGFDHTITEKGRTPIQLAEVQNKTQVVDIIRKYEQCQNPPPCLKIDIDKPTDAKYVVTAKT
ncbi:uncharacterized protein LOC128550573 [Mercenaria mercenaria]|uniref:uncharacterized protein LOC128550573 n=1 Tax=Mercenaria mercenaria TaxID=6596 RepID=UPI00234F47E9|nr:uncharacterized protein LOC128550573 [Mercenaria mercenaria]